MRIIQAPAVSAEVLELIAEKARVQVELDKMLTEIRERAAAISELKKKEKDFEDSFIGDAEWHKRILELRDLYKDMKKSYDKILSEKESTQDEVAASRAVLTKTQEYFTELERGIAGHRKQQKDLQVENERISDEIKAKNADFSVLSDVIKEAKKEKLILEEDLKKTRDDISKREQTLARKEQDLKVYENRIIKEYAILFPSVSVKKL